MKTENQNVDALALERELSEIAPVVKRGFRSAGEPSARVTDAIRREAQACAQRHQSRHRFHMFRVLAAAAVLMILVGGTIQFQLLRQEEQRALNVAQQLARVERAQKSKEAAESQDGLANVLLEIQGLNEETFFTAEGAEPLAL